MIINLKAIKSKEKIMKLFYFSLYKQKLLCDNKSMKSIESNQFIMARASISVRNTALLWSVINPWPPFLCEVKE